MDDGDRGHMLTPEVIRLIGTAEEMAREMDRLRRDTDWIESERERLLREHEGQWIAVSHQSVRAAAPSLDALLDMVDAQGLQREDVTVRYITSDEPTLILDCC